MPPPRKSNFGQNAWIYFFAIGIVAILGMFVAFRPASKKTLPPSAAPRPAPELADSVVFANYGGSANCKTCHETEYRLWQGSHHGIAERPIDPDVDGSAFK